MAGSGKAMTPAPIDRPLSKAYLRQFTGWSTMYPPGTSDPTSLRVMENAMVNRDGSIRVRPGMRYLSYAVAPNDALHTPGSRVDRDVVGTHEAFYLADGTKAYLFAVRETDNTIGFRVLSGRVVKTLADTGFTISGSINFSSATTYVKYLQIDNKIFALSNAGETMRLFRVGATKSAQTITAITKPDWAVADKLTIVQPDAGWITPAGPATTIPAAETPTAATLISNTSSANQYNFGFFYSFTNDVGESAQSQVTVIRAQRGWSAWRWETPSATGEPSGVPTSDPAESADQLVAYMPQAVFDAAKAQGAIQWNLYMLTWSDQDSVPATAVRVAKRDITAGSTYQTAGWLAATPFMADAAQVISSLPNQATRYNYSDPSRAGNGLVAADRMILVDDPTAAAVIRWSSNQQGSYTDFTASLGGGYKTLTSGNLYVPACVKLWQNPQSVDTLTILCMGVDGYSTGYYMSPAEVNSQSESVQIMGFEETTATPGTTSPFGCEVMNNALYHPLDEQLMKSSATMYNINHKAQTDQIQNSWIQLINKHHIVSSQHDNRLYYLVHNPGGAPLEANCWGNEIWVLDTAGTAGTWSRLLIQAQSLRKIEQNGTIYMGLVRPDGIYYLDPLYGRDDYPKTDGTIGTRPIPWKIETNTQGANRAHDAWCHLQQCNVSLGFFLGSMKYGVRGWDLHGRPVDVHKVVSDRNPGSAQPFDIDDFLEVRRDLQQWTFYAESATDADGQYLPIEGQLSLVQYRYTPVSVNVGYEYGSVETFEYGRDLVGSSSNTLNGVPQPVIDQRRP